MPEMTFPSWQRPTSRDSTDVAREIALAVTAVKLYEGMPPEEALGAIALLQSSQRDPLDQLKPVPKRPGAPFPL